VSEEIEDKKLSCIDCKRTFTWTADEQTGFHEKGMKKPPKRCADCEQDRLTRRSEFGHGGRG
jgi:DNA-directed RNA polymerase subunit RPC12/RpoP